VTSAPGSEYRLPSGAMITQSLSSNGLTFTYQYPVGQRTMPYYSYEFPSLKEKAKILGSDQYGENLVIQVGDQTFRVEPFKSIMPHLDPDAMISKLPENCIVSKDGFTFIGVSLEARTPELMIDKGGVHKFSFEFGGRSCEANRTAMSADGSAVVVEATDGTVFLSYPQRELVRAAFGIADHVIKLDQRELSQVKGVKDWNFSGNLLWSPHTDIAYVIG